MSNNLKANRAAAGLTQAELSRESGVTQAVISKLEQGTIRMTPGLAARLAPVFKKTPKELQGSDAFRLILVPDEDGQAGKIPDFQEALRSVLDGYYRDWDYGNPVDAYTKAKYLSENYTEYQIMRAGKKAKLTQKDQSAMACILAKDLVEFLANCPPAAIVKAQSEISDLEKRLGDLTADALGKTGVAERLRLEEPLRRRYVLRTNSEWAYDAYETHVFSSENVAALINEYVGKSLHQNMVGKTLPQYMEGEAEKESRQAAATRGRGRPPRGIPVPPAPEKKKRQPRQPSKESK